jgi:hypothetical protein
VAQDQKPFEKCPNLLRPSNFFGLNIFACVIVVGSIFNAIFEYLNLKFLKTTDVFI